MMRSLQLSEISGFEVYHPRTSTLFFQTLFSLLLCCFQSQSTRTNTSDLQDFSVHWMSIWQEGGRVLSTYVSLSVRSCIYNSESKIVLCPLCWVCYEMKWICTLIKKKSKKKRSQPDKNPWRKRKTRKYLWSAIILFQCLMFLHEMLSQYLSHRWHLGSCQLSITLYRQASAAHLGHICEMWHH